MIRTLNLILCLFVALCAFAVAEVEFTYSWKSPEAERVSFTGKKMAVILVSTNRAARRAAEEALAKEITKRGAEGIAAHTIVSETELKDREAAKSRFKEQGVAGAVVIRGTPEGGAPVDPDLWKNPIYKDIWGFTSSSWNQEEGTKKETKDVKFRVEIAVYALEQDRLIWMGATQMKSSKLAEFIQEIVDEIAEEMLKAGLLVTSTEKPDRP